MNDNAVTLLYRATPILIIVLFLALGSWYSLVVPAFETPDEVHHYAFARHLSQGNPLPDQTVEGDGPWEHEGTGAPLYYLLLGRLIADIDQNDFDQLSRRNPRANLGDPLTPGNKNYMRYSAAPQPLEGSNLALRIGRWFSLGLAGLTCLLTYAIARLAFPTSPLAPGLSMGIVALLPQFTFISATASNDNMVILSATAVLYWLARLLYRPSTAPIYLWELAVLGLLLGLAALSKLQGLGLIPLSLIVIATSAWLRRDWRLLPRALLLITVPVALIAGWWYWRNFSLYGDWLGISPLITISGTRLEPHSLAGFWGELRGVRYSFWGLFCWFSIPLPQLVYLLLDSATGLALLGLLGSAWATWQQRSAASILGQPHIRVRLLLLIWGGMLIGLMLYWLSFATSGQGRLLFPAISAWGVLCVVGLGFWLRRLPRSLRRPIAFTLPVGMALVSAYALLVLLPTSYGPLQPVEGVPSTAPGVERSYGEALELIALELPGGRFRRGEAVPVTLYLRAPSSLDEDHELTLQLLDEEAYPLGNITSHRGWGRFPTSLWQPGAIYADCYELRVTGEVGDSSPLLARVYLGFMDADGELLLVDGLADELASRTVGLVEIAPARRITLQSAGLERVDAVYGEVLRLAGANFSEQVASDDPPAVSATLLWEAMAVPAVDYTTFLHLTDAHDELIAGYDQPPAGDRFPTSRWQPGDHALTETPLALPQGLAPGDYSLWAGVYDPASSDLTRLPVTASKHPVQHQRVLLGTVTVLAD